MMDPGPGYQVLMWSKWYICDSGDRKSRLMTLTNIEWVEIWCSGDREEIERPSSLPQYCPITTKSSLLSTKDLLKLLLDDMTYICVVLNYKTLGKYSEAHKSWHTDLTSETQHKCFQVCVCLFQIHLNNNNFILFCYFHEFFWCVL